MIIDDIRTVERDGLQFSFRHEEEFEAIYKAIFEEEDYNFITTNPSPRIIDAGSHIGIAALYFKRRYPTAQVVCFEPNPTTFKLLEKNISQNRLEDITLVNAAVATAKGKIKFYVSKDEQMPWTWGDSAAMNKWVSDETTKTIKVNSVRLSEYINQEVDLLKLDVEGSEEEVLKEAEEKLINVKQIFMEFHGSSTNPTNDSEKILTLLKRNGFSYKIIQDGKQVEEQEISKDDPYWLIIHAYREE